MRSVLTTREYAAQMLIIGSQRLHKAEGNPDRSRLGVYPKKSRKDGAVRNWEARVTQAGIRVCFPLDTVLQRCETFVAM